MFLHPATNQAFMNINKPEGLAGGHLFNPGKDNEKKRMRCLPETIRLA